MSAGETKQEDHSFEALIEAARCGDAQAQDELHRRYVPQVMQRLRSRSKNGLRRSHDTVDLAQSVFVEVLKDLPRFESRGETAFRNWLLIKAESKVSAKFRRKYLEQKFCDSLGESFEPMAGPAGPLTDAGHRDRNALVREVLAQLSDEHRQVLILRQGQDLTYAQVAECIGLSGPDAARMRHARAIVAFRNQWTRQSPNS